MVSVSTLLAGLLLGGLLLALFWRVVAALLPSFLDAELVLVAELEEEGEDGEVAFVFA